ncbi:MAG: RNA polymerase sigma-70 factor (ECF subfamily) [Planctomycetota bacterium]|jgi:RNA polymerase sigma-70 factor (ECF subfamily)
MAAESSPQDDDNDSRPDGVPASRCDSDSGESKIVRLEDSADFEEACSEAPSSKVRTEDLTNTQRLLLLAREGSSAVWEVFFQRYREFLIYNIRVNMPEFARRQFDAEDILQSAFLAAWVNILNFEYKGEGSFRAYLKAIVLNHFRNQLRRAANQGRHLSLDEEGLVDGSDEDTDSGAKDPARIHSREDSLTHLIDTLRQQTNEDQEVLGMRFYESMTWTEMGQVLQCDRETAKERFLRALKRLQRKTDL